MKTLLIGTAACLLLASSPARAATPTKSAQVRGILKTVLGNMSIHRGWQPHAKFQPRLEKYGQPVLGLKRWKVINLQREGERLLFDAYKITDRSGGFTHGYRVRGSIDKDKADLDIWRLADGRRSGGAHLQRRGQQASFVSGHDAPMMEAWTAAPMMLDKLVAKALK